MPEKELKLKVAEAIQDDVNKGIVRIDSSFLNEVGVRPGDIVELEGERKTVAIADRAYPGDIGLNIVRMDGIIRKNSKTGIGEIIKVRKAIVKEGKKIIIAPARKGIVIKASPEIFKQGLLGRAVTKGDIVSLGGTRRRRTTMMESPFFEDVFNILDESMMGFGFGDIKFIVVDTAPKQPIIITEQTDVVFNPEAIEIKEEMVPEVTYEDIGGLDEEVKKVREMVELPLKHPEIFERLGIEAPKGVLLHGPPGTGKTLLAKAVANETNSHFILINGPEIMSKYYGQSLPYDEKILVMIDSKLRLIPIGEIVENKIENIEVPCFDSEGKIILREVSALIKHKFRRRLAKVTTASGRTITATDDHSLFALVNNKIESVKTSDLKENASLIVVPNSFIDEHSQFEEEVLLDGSQILIQLGKNLLGTQVNYDLVTKIEYLDQKPKYVYDISVPGCENFIAGFGGIFAHNSEENLRKKFEEAEKNAPSIVFIDEIDAIASKREDIRGEVERRVVAQLLALMDGLKSRGKVVVIAATNVPNILDPALRRPGRFDREIEIGVPGKEGRLNILKIHTRNMPLGKKVNLKELASITYGFVGADLASLAKEAAMILLRRIFPDLKLQEEEPIPKDILEKLRITQKDFKEALKVVRPSALREVLVEVPNVRWTDIGGLEDVKQELIEAVEWPLKYPDSFKRLGVNPPKGILLYGAPGTGKTLLAKAVANESQSNFILVKGPELLSMYVGESEKAVRQIFKKARQTSPTIVFFDEIDSLAPRRGLSSDSHVSERVVNQLLTEIDGLEEMHDVVIIAATNRPDIVDTALLRPGRFDRMILTPIPDEKTRLEIFKVHTQGMPLNINGAKSGKAEVKKKSNAAGKTAGDEAVSENELEEEAKEEIKINGKREAFLLELAKKTRGYVGSDIEAVCREAAIFALRENMQSKEVTSKHFEKAMKKVPASVDEEIVKTYEEMKDSLTSARAKQMKEEKPTYMG